MPFVINDEVATRDLIVPDSAEWTIGEPLPDGDASLRVLGAGTYAYTADTTGVFIPGGLTVGLVRTYEYWLKSANITGNRILFAHGESSMSGSYADPGNVNFMVSVERIEGTTADLVQHRWFRSTGSGEETVNNPYPIANNESWYHFAWVVTVIASSFLRGELYVNGQPYSTSTYGSNQHRQSFGANTRLWALNVLAGATPVQVSTGAVTGFADLAIYNRALTVDEINEHYWARVAR